MAAGSAWRAWAGLAVALVGLNLALSFYNLWPTPWITLRPELSVEAALLALLIAVAAGRGRRPTQGLVNALAALLLLFVLARYLEVTAPSLFGRTVNLYWDSRHLPAVAAMTLETRPGWQVALLVLAGLAGLALLYLALRALLGLLVTAVGQPRPRRATLALATGLIALFAAGRLFPAVDTLRWFSLPVTVTYAQQLRFVVEAVTSDPATLAGGDPLPDSRLARLHGSDLLVLFLESYGATTLDDPAHAAGLARARAHLAQRIDANGLGVVSARVRSPTFGGGSWRAHASLLTGIAVDDDRAYRLLLAQDRNTLVQRFAAQGYRTVGMMPGIQRAWPEGRFYRFDRIYDAASLDYPGPAFGWWVIPDQFALASLQAREIAVDPRPPLLAVMASITGHSPFRPLPPYVEDWQALLGPAPYPAIPMAAAETGSRPGEAYVAAMDYVLTTVAGYIDWASRREGRDLVMLLIGDHQPPAQVTGPDAAWDVPVHLVARDPALLDAVREIGFVDGLVPGDTALGGMHELTVPLLLAFDRPGEAAIGTGGHRSGRVGAQRVDVTGRVAGG